MDRYRLKNIIIIILALANFFLLGSLTVRQTSEHTTRRHMKEQLAELFAVDGMLLAADAVSDEAAPLPLNMSRDAAREQEVARFLLDGGVQRADQGGGIYSYAGAAGAALFREDGSFDAAVTSMEDAAELCRDFCKTFSYDEPVFTLDEEGSGTAAAVCLYDGKKVFNCSVTFRFERGALQSVSGTLLPEGGTVSAAERELLSSIAALTEFQNMRRETGAVVSAVTGMYPCYRLQSSASSPMSLVPVWCVETDTLGYYVNCVTGEVTTG